MTDELGLVAKKRRTPAEIEQLVREFESSGLNRSQFCRREGLTLGVLNRCLRRLQAGCGQSASGDGLVRVELAGQELGDSCGLSVILARGRRIAVNSGFDATTLQRLVQALEAM